MKEKEKAQELVDKYYQLAESIEWSDKDTMSKAEKLNDELGKDVLFYWNELAKKSALIAVDEIIKSQTCCDDFECKHEGSLILRWWGDVKREIINL